MKKLTIIALVVAITAVFAVTATANEWNLYGSARLQTFYESLDLGKELVAVTPNAAVAVARHPQGQRDQLLRLLVQRHLGVVALEAQGVVCGVVGRVELLGIGLDQHAEVIAAVGAIITWRTRLTWQPAGARVIRRAGRSLRPHHHPR